MNLLDRDFGATHQPLLEILDIGEVQRPAELVDLDSGNFMRRDILFQWHIDVRLVYRSQ